MPKKGWTKYKCQFCSADIKCNAKQLGATKVQLEQHEQGCSDKDDSVISKTSYLITATDISNMPVKQRPRPRPLTTPKKVNIKPSPQSPKSDLSESISNMTLDNLKYKSFSELPNIYLWDLDNGLYQPYSLYNQNIINRSVENKISMIFIIEVKYSSCLKYNNIDLHIEIDINNLKQRIIKRGTTPIHYMAYRNIKIISNNIFNNTNIPLNSELNSELKSELKSNKSFYDSIQKIQYTFNRTAITNFTDSDIKIDFNIDDSSSIELNKIIESFPCNLKVHQVYKINNDVQRRRYINCMKDLYPHVNFDEKTHKFQAINTIERNLIVQKQKEIIGSPGKNGLHTGIIPNEVIVFHGCHDSGLINSICETGFNPFLCNTSLYGHGIYLSRTFEYCARNGYAADLGENIFHMFVCRLITGSYCNGQNGQRIPNLLTKTQRCKTMVNSVDSPDIYAVQDPSQIEILYEIHFTFNKECEINYNMKETFVPKMEYEKVDTPKSG